MAGGKDKAADHSYRVDCARRIQTGSWAPKGIPRGQEGGGRGQRRASRKEPPWNIVEAGETEREGVADFPNMVEATTTSGGKKTGVKVSEHAQRCSEVRPRWVRGGCGEGATFQGAIRV